MKFWQLLPEISTKEVLNPKVQFGAARWFLDQLDGMTKQMNTLSNIGLISTFVGMLTDSRSLLSFSRHDYFRRLLCNLFGSEMERGLLPDDEKWVGKRSFRISVITIQKIILKSNTMQDSTKILCFGELLLHFAPDSEGNWLNEQSLKMYVGGAEYNVAAALSQWKNSVKLLSALPENFVGNQLESQLNNKGIEILAEKTQGRIGTFYLSSDGDMQNASVVYDRFPSVLPSRILKLSVMMRYFQE